MAERFRTFGQTHSMELIFFPLVILILVGLVANTFQSSAIQTAPILPTPFCTGNIEPGECYPTNVNGCDSNVSANCNFTSSTKFAFLAQNSPFTLLMEGNFNGFISAIIHPASASLGTNSPFVYFPNSTQTDNLHPNDTGTSVFAICLNINGTSWPGGNGGFGGLNVKLQCNQIYLNSTQVPHGMSKVFGNATGATDSLNCTSYNGWAGFGNAYVYFGCDAKYPNPPGAKFMMVAVNATDENNANAAGGGVDMYATILLTDQQAGFHSTQDPNYCMLVIGRNGPFISKSVQPTPLCRQWGSALGQTLGTNSQGLFGTFLVLGFIAGIVFLVMALGVNLNVQILTSGLGLGANDQGTKLMQAVGIGLLSWTFILSEFGSWLNALPFNLGSIVFLIFTTMFFMGLYWRLFSFE